MKVNFVHVASESASRDDPVHDSGIENMNKNFLSEANDIVNDLKTLGLAFKELDSKVIDVLVSNLLQS